MQLVSLLSSSSQDPAQEVLAHKDTNLRCDANTDSVLGNLTKCEGLLHAAGHEGPAGAQAWCLARLGDRQWGYLHWIGNPSAVHFSGMGTMRVNVDQAEFNSLAIRFCQAYGIVRNSLSS